MSPYENNDRQDKTNTRRDLDRFKAYLPDLWTVAPSAEKALKELREKHNALVDFLSADIK